MVIRPVDIAAYNQATGPTEEDPHAAEDTDTDHKRPREEPNGSDDDDQARPRTRRRQQAADDDDEAEVDETKPGERADGAR